MASDLTRRNVLERLCMVASAALAATAPAVAQTKTTPAVAQTKTAPAVAQAKVAITVYKSPTCGCCKLWVDHMNANGFVASVKDLADVNPIKREHKVAQPLWSCHTALVGNYVIEGHVPAADVKKFLAAAPKGAVGLTIPGMPASAPGMDLKPFRPYDVLSFDAQGKTTVFASHQSA